jgi:hypothetical protein
MHHEMRGGFNETVEKLLTVMPCGLPMLSTVVITVMPVAKFPKALRKSIVD